MLLAIVSLAAIGFILGAVLGIAARYLAVESDPLEAELLALLPGSQCGQCGYVGCALAAAAIAKREAAVTICVPGGRTVAERLAKRLGVKVDLSGRDDSEPCFAVIDENKCLGCTRCIQECTTDAIVGAPKQMHTVLADNCHGCQKCFNTCPTMAISMQKIQVKLADWHWPKPKMPPGRKRRESS